MLHPQWEISLSQLCFHMEMKAVLSGMKTWMQMCARSFRGEVAWATDSLRSLCHTCPAKKQNLPCIRFYKDLGNELAIQGKHYHKVQIQAQKLIYSYTFSQLLTKDETLVSEHLNYWFILTQCVWLQLRTVCDTPFFIQKLSPEIVKIKQNLAFLATPTIRKTQWAFLQPDFKSLCLFGRALLGWIAAPYLWKWKHNSFCQWRNRKVKSSVPK